MVNEYGLYDRYGDEMQNLGLRRREHERLDQLLKEERSLFGLTDAALMRMETLNRLTDENGFAEEERQN